MNNPYSAIFSAFVAFFITIILIPVLIRVAARYALYDVPGGRKAHSIPVPRLGGVAMTIGASVPVFLWMHTTPLLRSSILGMAAVAFVGLIDDLIQVRWWKKLLVQLAAATLVVTVGKVRIVTLGFWAGDFLMLPTWLSISITILFILAVTNAINLADGLDGLAAGLCVLIFGTILALAYLQGLKDYLVPICAIIGALIGFLRFNTYPATIFMGDAGSYLLGFSAAVFGILVTQSSQGSVAPSILLLVLGLPLLDTMEVMLERFVTGNPVFLPDRRHLHYRLVRLGFSHREAVIVLYALQALYIYLVIKLMFSPDWVVLTAFLLLAFSIMALFYIATKRGWRFKRRWVIESWMRGRLKEKYQSWLVESPRRLIELMLVCYIVGLPLLPGLVKDGYHALFALVPILFLLGHFFLKDYLGFIVRLFTYIFLSVITYDLVWILPQKMSIVTLAFYGGLASLILFLGVFLKFASPETFWVTAMDVLVVLVAIAIPLFPMEHEQARIISLYFFTLVTMFFSVEAIMNKTQTSHHVLMGAVTIGAIIVGVKALF